MYRFKRYNSKISNVLEHFSSVSESTFWSKWFVGLIIPIVILLYAMRCCIFQKAEFIGKHGVIFLRSTPAVFMGLNWLSAAAFLNFHYFWTTLKRLCIFADTGKVISLLCWISTFVFVCWLIFTDTIHVKI